MKICDLVNILKEHEIDPKTGRTREVQIWAESAGSSIDIVMLSHDKKKIILADLSYTEEYLWEEGETINDYTILYR